MKFKIQMKDPDALYDAISDAIHADTENIADDDERMAVKEVRRDKVGSLCTKWFKYGEYLTVEIDTEAQTCTVVPVRS